MKLTRDEILNMPAGRALDALIAQEVMGRVRKEYSTDIAAAWEVVEKLKRDGWYVSVFTGHKFECALSHPNPKRGNYCKDETAPLAICRAALLAVTDTYR